MRIVTMDRKCWPWFQLQPIPAIGRIMFGVKLRQFVSFMTRDCDFWWKEKMKGKVPPCRAR